jgi:heme O synthase-like polyprenyltransferase
LSGLFGGRVQAFKFHQLETVHVSGCADSEAGFFCSLLLLSTFIDLLFRCYKCKYYLQFLEVPYDAQMNRTKTRPIVKGQIR